MASVGAPAKDAGFEGKPEGEEGERSADRVRFIFFRRKDPIRRYLINYKNKGNCFSHSHLSKITNCFI